MAQFDCYLPAGAPFRTLQPGDKGIVVYPEYYQEFEKNNEDIPEEDREYHTIYWYDTGYREYIYPDRVKRCAGLRNKRLCSTCKDNELCSHLREIAHCDISEFRKGKRDIDICKERKCKQRFYCWTHRLIQIGK